MSTTQITLCGKAVRFFRPRFVIDSDYTLGVHQDGDHGPGGFDSHLEPGLRPLSTAEFAELVKRVEESERWSRENVLFGELMVAYFLESRTSWPGLCLNDGIVLTGQTVTVFKGIRGKIKPVEDSLDTTAGYKPQLKLLTEHQDFSLARLFRKYNPAKFTLGDLASANPDLFEYLFGVEWRDLPPILQNALFTLPFDEKKERVPNRFIPDGNEILPLTVQISFCLKEHKEPGIEIVTFVPCGAGNNLVLVQ